MMDFIFELIFELFFEGSLELSQNKKLSKWIRYPLMLIVAAFFAFIIGLIFFLGAAIYRDNRFISLIIHFIGIMILIGSIIKLRNMWKDKN